MEDKPTPEYRRVFKILFYSRDDPETVGAILKGDAIEHEGRLWFVPMWYDSKEEAWSVPLRLVCLSTPEIVVCLQKLVDDPKADFLLNYPIPIADLSKETAPEKSSEFLVIERPPLKILKAH